MIFSLGRSGQRCSAGGCEVAHLHRVIAEIHLNGILCGIVCYHAFNLCVLHVAVVCGGGRCHAYFWVSGTVSRHYLSIYAIAAAKSCIIAEGQVCLTILVEDFEVEVYHAVEHISDLHPAGAIF